LLNIQKYGDLFGLPENQRGKTLFSSSWRLEKRRRWQEALEPMALVAVIPRLLDLNAIKPLNNRINVINILPFGKRPFFIP
jgi:hypothetical protein